MGNSVDSQYIPFLWRHLSLWRIRHGSWHCLLGIHKWTGTKDTDWWYCEDCPVDRINGKVTRMDYFFSKG
jgi:hypothetical protein